MKNVLLFSFVLLLTSCNLFKESQEESSSERVNHVVFCWLKDSGNNVHRAQIIETSMQFKNIPGVLEVRAGEVIKSDRSIVESTYDVAIFLSFKNKEDLASYIQHKDHQLAVKTVLKPLVSKILVYDFISQ
jgi:hypothetical protein